MHKLKSNKTKYCIMCLLVVTCNASISKIQMDRIEINSSGSIDNTRGILTYTAGGDNNCDYQIGVNTLQDAIDAAPGELRLATNTQYNGISISATTINIVGGYDDCLAAENNVLGANKSIINGSIQNNFPAVDVVSANVNLSNLILQNGTVGLRAQQSSGFFNLENIIIQDNNNVASTLKGAGVILSNINNPFFKDVKITNNKSSAGAGIYCENQQQLTIVGESSIDNNEAVAGSGGAIYGINCDINIVGGSNSANGIIGNTSSQSGGGVFLAGSSTLTITGGLYLFDNSVYGDLSQPFHIDDNIAGGAGGGVFSSGSNVNLINISMSNNMSLSSGGALYGQSNSTVNIFRSDEKCWSNISCNLFSGNKANAFGGTLYANGGTLLNLTASRITQSRSDIAVVLFIGGPNSVANVNTSIMDNNGDNGNNSYSDFEIIKVNNTAKLNLTHSTIVENNSVNTAIDIVGSIADIENSFLYNPNIPIYLSMSGNSSENSSCLFVDENNTAFGSVDTLSVTEFMESFVDVTVSNYHLSSSSLAIDQCLLSTIPVLKDIDGDDFGYDAQGLNGSGLMVHDIGADEEVGIIFMNGFE